MDESLVKTNCDTCGSEMDCPKDMLEKTKKRMCHACFLGEMGKGSKEEFMDTYVDFHGDEFILGMADDMAQEMVDEIFKEMWSDRKKEFKYKSKREIAYEMFGSGAFIAISNLLQLQLKKEIDCLETKESVKETMKPEVETKI